MFVKYSCGCVAYRHNSELSFLVDYCCRQAEDDVFCIVRKTEDNYQDLDDREFVPLSSELVIEIMEEWGKLIHDGYDMRRLTSVLKPRFTPKVNQ